MIWLEANWAIFYALSRATKSKIFVRNFWLSAGCSRRNRFFLHFSRGPCKLRQQAHRNRPSPRRSSTGAQSEGKGDSSGHGLSIMPVSALDLHVLAFV